jgi:hypothetical protein
MAQLDDPLLNTIIVSSLQQLKPPSCDSSDSIDKEHQFLVSIAFRYHELPDFMQEFLAELKIFC